MPKIIDRDAYRAELAGKAIAVFTEHGYNGLGMRGIAEAIGVSKSALYHYFPAKKDLFSACTELVTQEQNLYGNGIDAAVPETPDQKVLTLLANLDARFRGELVLMLDYTRERSAQDIAGDALLRKADNRFIGELAKVVGSAKATQAYALVMGGLMTRLLNGQQTSLEEIADWILTLSEG